MKPLGKLATAITIVCLLLGSFLLIQAYTIKAKAILGQWLIEDSWRRTLEDGRPVKPWPWADSVVSGRLTVPALGKSFVLLSGASGSALAFAPGLVRMPKASDDQIAEVFMVQAHRDTHFDFLKSILPEDELVLELPDQTLHFGVRQLMEADGAKAELVFPSEARAATTLVLSTCSEPELLERSVMFPDGQSKGRYLVVATSCLDQHCR